MKIKTVRTVKSAIPASAEPCETLQQAIDMAWGTIGHIHEGPINPVTGYPIGYAVCDNPDCK